MKELENTEREKTSVTHIDQPRRPKGPLDWSDRLGHEKRFFNRNQFSSKPLKRIGSRTQTTT